MSQIVVLFYSIYYIIDHAIFLFDLMRWTAYIFWELNTFHISLFSLFYIFQLLKEIGVVYFICVALSTVQIVFFEDMTCRLCLIRICNNVIIVSGADPDYRD